MQNTLSFKQTQMITKHIPWLHRFFVSPVDSDERDSELEFDEAEEK